MKKKMFLEQQKKERGNLNKVCTKVFTKYHEGNFVDMLPI